jgi:hypothetical protein
MSEEDSKDNEREDDKKPEGVLSEGFVGSNPTPRTFVGTYCSYHLPRNDICSFAPACGSKNDGFIVNRSNPLRKLVFF